MNRQFKYLLIILVGFLISFSSCEKDEDDDTPGLNALILECDAFKSSNPDKILVLEDRNNSVDYIIDCNITVTVDLVIEPGVVIEFVDAVGLTIGEYEGSISAVGSQSKPIVFTSQTKTKGAWKGILSYSESVKNRFDYVTISYAGCGSFNSNGDLGSLVLWADAFFRLNNVTINNGNAYGINLNYNSYDVEINNCTITTCEMPIYADANIANHISGGNFTGNATDVIRLRSDFGNRAIQTNQTWTNLGVPYRISSTLAIKNGGILTIEAGVVVELEDAQGISVGGGNDDGDALIAVGTSTNPITFTGVTKTAGAWKSIYYGFSTSVQNNLSYILIEYAGGIGTEGAIETWSADPILNINNSKFKDIRGCGIYDYNYANSPNPNITESNNTTENVSGSYMCTY